MEDKNKNTGTFNDLFSNSIKEKNNTIFPKNDVPTNSNKPDIFDTTPVKNNTESHSNFASINDIFAQAAKEETNKKTLNIDSSNPFFKNQKTDSSEGSQKETNNNNNNLFFATPKLDSTNSINSNPFFENQKSDSSEGSQKEINTNNNNPFFEKPKLDNDNNVFFDNKINSINESSKNKDTIDKKHDLSINNQDKLLDDNPFFANNTSPEENPLLNNKISLMAKANNTNDQLKIDTSNVTNYNVKVVKKKEPLLKVILGIMSYALFIWLLLIGIVLLVYILDIKIRALKGDNSPPKYNAYVVLTGSMLPEIQVYDVVVTKRVEPKNLEKGDVITFASSDTRFLNTIITHRILSKNYDAETKTYTFQTKGDNNNVADSEIGRASCRERV